MTAAEYQLTSAVAAHANKSALDCVLIHVTNIDSNVIEIICARPTPNNYVSTATF